MAFTVGIDPGKNLGVALFKNGQLKTVNVFDEKTFIVWLLSDSGDRSVHCIVEMPQVYRAAHSKGDPNHLMPLAKQCGMVQLRAAMIGAVYQEAYPREWKGQLTKAACHARIKTRLTSDELLVAEWNTRNMTKDEVHNAWDAIGIGLWGLGRFKPNAR
jgi:hypothetical protein